MSVRMRIRRKPKLEVKNSRMGNARNGARRGATYVTGWVVPVSGKAAHMAGRGAIGARRWTAPQLDRAASYLDHEVAPRMSTALHNTARRIEPARPATHRIRNMVLGMSVIAAVLAMVGMASARRRNQMLDLLEPETTLENEAGKVYESADGAQPDAAWAGRGAGTGSSRGIGSDH